MNSGDGILAVVLFIVIAILNLAMLAAVVAVIVWVLRAMNVIG
jgi:hypothetical protein